MQIWNMLHAARWKCRMQKVDKKSPYGHYHTILSGYVFATKACINNRKKLLNNNTSSICLHNIVDVGPLTAENGWRVWGTPANFNWFRVLASLLHRRRSTEVNKTLQDVWPSPGLIHYVYIFGGSCPLTEWNFASCKIHFASKFWVLLYWQRYCTTLEQRPSAKLCRMVRLWYSHICAEKGR